MIRIDVIPHEHQRYNTLGDYFEVDDILHFKISDMGNRNYEFLILVHEMVERHICQTMGVTDQQIDDWDFEHLDAYEPGAVNGCPYALAHLVAEQFERSLANMIGVR